MVGEVPGPRMKRKMMARQVNNGFSMGRSQFVSCIRHILLLPPSFTDNNSDLYFGQAWLRRSTEVVNGQRRDIDKSNKNPAAASFSI